MSAFCWGKLIWKELICVKNLTFRNSAPTKKKKKKPTPSTVRRNARRREEFVRKKLASSAKEPHQEVSEEVAETADLEKIFKCDQCRKTD